MLIANSLIEHGAERYRPGEAIPAVDEPTQALWLTQGLAVLAPTDNASPPAAPDTTGTLDTAQLEGMTLAALKQLAADMEVDTKSCKAKADYVAAISAVRVEPGEGAEGGGDDGPDV